MFALEVKNGHFDLLKSRSPQPYCNYSPVQKKKNIAQCSASM